MTEPDRLYHEAYRLFEIADTLRGYGEQGLADSVTRVAKFVRETADEKQKLAEMLGAVTKFDGEPFERGEVRTPRIRRIDTATEAYVKARRMGASPRRSMIDALDASDGVSEPEPDRAGTRTEYRVFFKIPAGVSILLDTVAEPPGEVRVEIDGVPVEGDVVIESRTITTTAWEPYAQANRRNKES